MSYRVKAPPKVVADGRFHPAYWWWRIEEDDGSTVAFVPDELTARHIAALLEANPAWNVEGGRS